MRPSVPEPANLTQAPLRPPVPLRCRDGRALRPHPSQAFRAQFIPHVSQALLASCPHEMSLQTYGAEVYGPLRTPLPSHKLQPMIPPGGLAYSEQGNYLCVFWGAVPAWPVDYIGQIDEWEPLAKGAWSELRVLRVQDDDCGE